MKLTCTQENLLKGLAIVARLGEKNVNLPILSNVLLRAQKEGLTLVATNLEIGIKTKNRGKIEEEGEFTVNARLLADFVATLPKENVSLRLEDKNLHIQGENHETTIRGMDANEFPLLPEVEGATAITIKKDVLRETLIQTLFSVSFDEARTELTGILIVVDDGGCTFAATDSYRLSEKKIRLSKPSKEQRRVVVPARTLSEVLRILDIEDAAEVTIRINESQIHFTIGDTELVSRIIAGEYPDYQQIIPKSFSHEVTFAVQDMVRAVKTTSLFCKQGINDIRLSLDKRFTDIAINAENSMVGKNVSNVQCKTAGQEMDIVFNYKFFLDGLNHLIGDEATLKTNDAASPALLTSTGENDFLYIIMPIRQ